MFRRLFLVGFRFGFSLCLHDFTSSRILAQHGRQRITHDGLIWTLRAHIGLEGITATGGGIPERFCSGTQLRCWQSTPLVTQLSASGGGDMTIQQVVEVVIIVIVIYAAVRFFRKRG